MLVRCRGKQEYVSVWQEQKLFTHQRGADTLDEIWLLEHLPVFTQGQAGKAEHVLNAGSIPVVYSDRGGQVTYHGPGQLVVYFLLDIKRRKISIREFITTLEQAVIELLSSYEVAAHTKQAAPGVYINDKKICSLGLRVRHGCTYHGLSLNIAMDLEPFTRINPCGYAGMQVVQLSDYVNGVTVDTVATKLLSILQHKIGY